MTTYALSEAHRFRGTSNEFLYLVPSGGIFAIDPISAAILDTLGDAHSPLDRDHLIHTVSQKTAAAPLDVLGCVN